MEYLFSALLILLSALFSGLTLGLLSLDVQSLERRARHGNKYAKIIYPLRKRGNLLLTTLLLGNVAVNTTLSIFLSSIASGLVAGITATALIVVFGEIIPQSVISRHALYFGAKTAPFTKFVLVILWPIAYPIAKILDYFLGHEMPTVYTKSELIDIVAEHESSDLSDIDNEERRIVQGALKFSHVHVADAMTPREKVVMYSEDEVLSEKFFEEINDTGLSRFPVYDDNKDAIAGVLYAKDLIVENENITIKETEEALDKKTLTVQQVDMLDTVLVKMLNSKRHLAIVRDEYNAFVGIITLEDIMEEIIQQEIEDEDDV